ncbi:Argonaute/Dicer protein, PAZ [Metarhizium rileyi]|uniref:Argonaute/Dicer protein, PAZ n=1 Tax=Metarhizium rileyi (strain RCEF 4871) TaxID=1649241 RepID=A0A166YLW3_METRR|nr:Argonaute/Dicer protein, PAZ [Metarhizium rileyi RCEF 4871]
MAHPPRVRQHGAGAKEVEFWLDSAASSSSASKLEAKGGTNGKGKGKGKEKAQAERSAAFSSGRYISVFEFFRTTYNRVLQYPQLPLINYGNRENPMYLPAEVCVVFAGQPSKSKLDGADIVEDLTHNMCYFSSHATKAVSLCPSAYYGDLASARDATWPACSIRRHHHGFILAEFH